MLTLKPRLSRRQPMEEAATPLLSEETTPPVTKIYFGAIRVARAVVVPPRRTSLTSQVRRTKAHRGWVSGLYLQTLISNDVQIIMGLKCLSVNSNSSRF